MRSDPGLPPPPPCPDPPRVEGPSDLLAHAGPAARRPFVLATARSRAVGDEMAGIERAEAGGHPLLRELRVGDAPASNVVLGPRSSRRELLAGGRTVVEVALVAERPGGLIVQWSAGPGPSGVLPIGFRAPAGADGHRAAEGGLTVRDAGGGVVHYRLFPAGARWEVGDGDAVRAEVPLTEGGVVTLVAARGGTPDEAAAALTGVARARVHGVRAERGLETARRERLALHTGVADLDDALEWAKARLEAAPTDVGAEGDIGPLREALVCLGTAAAGDHAGARGRVAALGREGAGALLALGWAGSWTGSAAAWSAEEIEAAARAVAAGADGPQLQRLVARAGVRAAADLLAGMAGRERAEALRSLVPPFRPAAPGAPSPGGRSGGRRLPVVGPATAPGGPDDGGGRLVALLAAIFEGSGPLPPASSPGAGAGPETALEAWARFAADRPDEGYPALRAHLEEAFRGPRGCWSGPAGSPFAVDDPVAAALVPAVLLHGLLGARPDAPFGRLRLAPALPASWSRFRITGIRLGDAALELACRVEGGRRTFVLRPTAGSVPPTVVFEPSVPGGVSSVEVDGEPAELEPADAGGGRTRVSVQIPLDRERTVSLHD